VRLQVAVVRLLTQVQALEVTAGLPHDRIAAVLPSCRPAEVRAPALQPQPRLRVRVVAKAVFLLS
jgi:hypothetical protein